MVATPDSSDHLATVSLVLGVAAAALSGSALVAGVLVGASVAVGVPVLVLTRLRHRVARLALGVIVIWVGYAAAIGSLPGWSVDDWYLWVSSEGRALLPLLGAAVAVSIGSRSTVGRVLVASGATILVSLLVGAVAYWVPGLAPPGFPIEQRDLFFGLASSHHVVGYLATAVVLATAALPSLAARPWRIGAVLIAGGALALSGSRTGMAGTAVGLAVVAWPRIVALARTRPGRWRLVAAIVALGLAATVTTAAIPRVRSTATAVTNPTFLGDALLVFRTASHDEARARSTSEAEANILLRFADFGAAWHDEIVVSPIIGTGAFRLNDEAIRTVGRSGLVLVVVEAEPNYDDADAHNLYLQVLAETGLVGMALLGTVFVWAWPRGRRDPLALLTRASTLSVATMSLVSIGFLGTGLGLVTAVTVFAASRGSDHDLAASIQRPVPGGRDGLLTGGRGEGN